MPVYRILLLFNLCFSLLACSPKADLGDPFDPQAYQQHLQKLQADPEQNPEDLGYLSRLYARPDFEAAKYQGKNYRELVREAKQLELKESRK